MWQVHIGSHKPWDEGGEICAAPIGAASQCCVRPRPGRSQSAASDLKLSNTMTACICRLARLSGSICGGSTCSPRGTSICMWQTTMITRRVASCRSPALLRHYNCQNGAAQSCHPGSVQEGPISAEEFQVPSFCPEKPDPGFASRFHKNTGGLAKMRALLPNAQYGAPKP